MPLPNGTILPEDSRELASTPTLFLDDAGRFKDASRLPFNPGSSYNGTDYLLETGDGMSFRIDGRTGEINDIEDPGGNRLEVSEGDIRSVDPAGNLLEEVQFQRDQRGRITAVVDSAGESIRRKTPPLQPP